MRKIKRAFSLIELLVVIIIISLAYGVVYTKISETSKQTASSLKFENIKAFMEKAAKKYKTSLKLVCESKNHKCYLFSQDKKVEDVEFLDDFIPYRLNKYEELLIQEYGVLKIEQDEFKVSLVAKRFENGVYLPLIVYTPSGEWKYLSPYFGDIFSFENEADLVSFILKKEYLPMIAGLANE